MSIWPTTQTMQTVRRLRSKKPRKLAPAPKKAVQKLIKKAIIANVEEKYVSAEAAGPFAVPTTYSAAGYPILTDLNNNYASLIGMYDPSKDSYGMVGNEIRLQQVDFGYSIYHQLAASAGASFSVRVFLLYDNEPSTDTSFTSTLSLYGTAVNYDDLVLRTPLITSPYYATERNKKGTERFTVIYDKIHHLNDFILRVDVRKKISLRNKKIKFSQTSLGGNCYPMTANLLLFIIGEGNSTATADIPYITWNTRTWYTDA